MYWINIGAVFIGGLNICLALLVILRNPKNKINITFSLAALCVGLWAAGEAIFRDAETVSQAFFWARFENTFGALITVFFLLFCWYFPYAQERLGKIQMAFIFVTTTILLWVVIFSNLYVERIFLNPPRNDFYLGIFGRMYFASFMVIYLLTAYYLLTKKYLSIEGIFKKNISVIILGTFLLSSMGIIFGVIGPMLNGADNYWFVSYTSIPMVFICGWFTLFGDKKLIVK